MRFERESDIPAFRLKSRNERAALRRDAFARDKRLIWISCLGGAMMGPIFALSGWLVRHFTPQPSMVLFVIVYLLLAIPTLILFRGFFVTPRVRRALETHENVAG